MSDQARTGPATPETGPGSRKPAVAPQRQALLQLPGLAAIGLYMLILAGVVVLGVVGGHFQPLFLAFAPVFIAAGLGLLLLLRWAWAMTLAAVVLLACLFAWQFSAQHAFPFIVQGLLNLVFFLYLVRPEVREKLR
ncbi:MAG: hypothetical protein P4K94_05680 [Terracidiphilus sp.]|nr:hypothetical protein [Terracidiphilus sp.]